MPNVGYIDEALTRPGRCFATFRTSALDRRQAEALLARLRVAALLPPEMRSMTLAALYRLVGDTTDDGGVG